MRGISGHLAGGGLAAVLLLSGLPSSAAATAEPTGSATPAIQKVELNSASMAQLMALPGIGKKRATDIIHQRQRRPFRRPSEITRVRGIGWRTYKRLRPRLRVVYPPPKPTEDKP